MRKLILSLLLFVTACSAQSTPTAVPAANTQAPPAAAAVASPTSGPATTVPSITQRPNNPATQQPNNPTTNFAVESTAANGDRVLGKPDAPVTIADYSDFL